MCLVRCSQNYQEDITKIKKRLQMRGAEKDLWTVSNEKSQEAS